jgi:hypothetical protein
MIMEIADPTLRVQSFTELFLEEFRKACFDLKIDQVKEDFLVLAKRVWFHE